MNTNMVWFIGCCGVAGAASRFYLGKWITEHTRTNFPWGTWTINLIGSFVLGALFALFHRHSITVETWQMAGTGFCGAFTTFSTFGFETTVLVEQRNWRSAITYVGTTVCLGILVAWCGMELLS